jgi:lipoprotein-releasing system permease protein
MISGLLIIILERTNFIGIMKALGAHNRRIQSLFLYFSSFIVFRGLFLGNLIALLLVALQKHFGIIRLDPETYYVDVMPLQIDWFSILCINIATLVVCMMALLLPSLLVSNIHPARSIRFE